jgi:hypothetical protein
MLAVSVDPATACLTMPVAALYDNRPSGEPMLPVRLTGRYQALWSLLLNTSRTCGVLRKSCTATTSCVSCRSLSTSVR